MRADVRNAARLVNKVGSLLPPLAFGLSLTAGCAGHIIHDRAASGDLPHVAWALSAGSSEGSQHPICSSEPGTGVCTLVASTDERPQTALFALQLHAAAQTVAYLGTYRVTFLASSSRIQEVNQEVPPGTDVKSLAVLDTVTSIPGNYTVEVELRASMGNKIYPSKFTVPVAVR